MYLYSAYAPSISPTPNKNSLSLSTEHTYTHIYWSPTQTMMKHNFHLLALVFFLVFLVTTPLCSSRKLAAKQGELDHVKMNNIAMEPVVMMKSTDSFDKLMGMEGYCENEEDEECLKRRVIAEAHLDYIYTQHHKP